jgi:pimeloyl-ACP methyl ester carboxylesterase
VFEGLADTPEAKLWYWDTGGDGEALVLCHPASQGCHIWGRQRETFVAAGFRVIAYARRGYDHSETGEADQPGTSVGDLVNLLDHIGIDQAHVMGAAAGGITATGFSVAHGQRTRSLILAGTIVAPAEAEWRTMYARLGIADLHGHVPTEFLELGPTYRASNPEGTTRFGELSALARTARTQKQPLGVEVTWKTLEQMKAPTLLLTGEADLYAPPPLHALVAEHLMNPRLETMREVGHAPYWESPEVFNAIVLDFLQSL